MNFIPGFIILTFYIKLAKLLLNQFEMLDKLKEVKYTPPPECEAAMRAKWYPETRYYYMYCDEVGRSKPLWNIPDMSSCSGFDCWESQLTYVSKIDILDIFNQYRELVADGTCAQWCSLNKNRLVFELNWNYMAEKAASQILANCPTEYSDSFVKEDLSGTYAGPILTHLAVTSFELKTGLQREMRLLLPELIFNNYMKDWGENYQFRRGLMTDVGCAFLLRRNVNYVTARQEVVESGNVGYLACYFIRPHEKEAPAEVILETTEENCKEVRLDSEYRIPRKNRYLSLCRKSPIYNATYDICNNLINPYTKKDVSEGECNNSDEFSHNTWMEKFYGLIVRRKEGNPEFVAECNVPETPLNSDIVKEGPSIYNYNCTLKHEVFVDANETFCGKNWNCEESQLTDVMKISILKYLNVARQTVATGICNRRDIYTKLRCKKGKTFCNIARLEWHWYLEWKAAEKVRNCPVEYGLKKNIQYNNSPFREPVTFEEATILFELPFKEGQLELGRKFKRFFWHNLLYDWDGNRFRRGSALWIGCAILQRANIKSLEETKPELILSTGDGVTTHMVCIYAALQDGFFSTPGPANDTKCCPTCDSASFDNICHTHTVKNLHPYPSLCSSPFLDMTMSCQVQYCKPSKDTEVSLAWRRGFEGHTIYQLVDGSFQILARKRMNDNLQKMDFAFEKKCCLVLTLSLIMLLVLVLLVLSLIFRYKAEGKQF